MKSKHDDIGRILRIGCDKCEGNEDHGRCKKQKVSNMENETEATDLVCNECDHKDFKSQSLRREHYKQMHPGVKIFKCGECNHGDNYLPNLNSHINSKHKKKELQCPKCPYTTTWNQSFHAHMRTNHGIFQKNSKNYTDGKTFLCEGCGLSTFSKGLYEAHKAAPNCEVAPKSISMKGRYIGGHKKTPIRRIPRTYKPTVRYYVHRPAGNFKCNKCDYSSDKPIYLKQHIKKVHDFAIVKCEYPQCTFQSKSKIYLKTHVDKDHKDIRYFCDICDFQSYSKRAIKLHKEKVHEKKYRYKCTLCDCKSYFPSEIRQHLNSSICKGSVVSL